MKTIKHYNQQCIHISTFAKHLLWLTNQSPWWEATEANKVFWNIKSVIICNSFVLRYTGSPQQPKVRDLLWYSVYSRPRATILVLDVSFLLTQRRVFRTVKMWPRAAKKRSKSKAWNDYFSPVRAARHLSHFKVYSSKQVIKANFSAAMNSVLQYADRQQHKLWPCAEGS